MFLLLFLHPLGIMCFYIILFADIMHPHLKHDEIDDICSRLQYENMDSKASGSIEELGVCLDEGIEQQHTRIVSRHIVSTMYRKGGGEDYAQYGHYDKYAEDLGMLA